MPLGERKFVVNSAGITYIKTEVPAVPPSVLRVSNRITPEYIGRALTERAVIVTLGENGEEIITQGTRTSNRPNSQTIVDLDNVFVAETRPVYSQRRR